jgi:alpha-D-xyloside xylohydrolase
MLKKATVYDIAKALGVSTGTAHRALHNSNGVSPATKTRVLHMAKALGYRPNWSARYLSQKGRIQISVTSRKLCALVGWWVLSVLGMGSSALAQWNPLNPVKSVKQQADGVVLAMQTGTLRLLICSESMIRVTYAPGASFPDTPQYVVNKTSWPATQWTVQSSDKDVTVATAAMKITIAKKNGAILFSDSAGKKLFQDDDRTLTAVEVNGEKTYHSEMFSNLWDSTEGFYGLGQHQAGVWNYHGEAVDLSQDNTNISVPMFLSSNGYGIFWNNTSRSRFNNRFVHALYLSSEVADTIDYYFLYGPEFDKVIAGYRELTGAAPLFGKWAYGFWQCKNKYESQAEVLSVAHKYRELHLPVDNIVQDWFWWNTMGEPVFNKNYPDPKGMNDDLHANHFHVMYSFWPYFRPGSPVYDEMSKRGYFIDRTKVSGFHPEGQALYDAFHPAARTYYWQLIDKGLFRIGADAWWLDTDEPETEGRETNILVNNKVALGSGARYANLYSLMTSSAVYEGQRKASDQKRVFILSRSGFAGIQRDSVAAWSGDVESTWLSFARQIPAGLNFELSGIPYWTTDIGGFIIGNPDDPAYRELYVRWFEYGTFCPIFRAHGTRTTNQNELWSYGPEAQTILASYDRLRYRLMPYIYSLAWKTTSESYTPMRALAMDFRTDTQARNIGDQFLFGPALLVSPVTEPSALSRRIYLPKAKWYDFWTGRGVEGGSSIQAAAPLNQIPLYVRGGSIVPLGPDVQYATEKPADPIELRIYTGADGNFTLYEDENDNYNYEKGAYATIPILWNDATRTLTIGERQGKFPGMIENRSFHVVFVHEGHGIGIDSAAQPDKVVGYSGKPVVVAP